MTPSAFEGFLVPERFRRKSARDGGFALPAFLERIVEPSDGPFLVSSSRRTFLQPGVSQAKMLRFGFSPCPPDEEHYLLSELFRCWWRLSEELGWTNRCRSLAQAKQRMESYGLLPRTVIVPFVTLKDVCGQDLSLEDARKLVIAQGCVAEVEGLRVLFSDLPPGQMLLGTAPPLVGVCTRVDDHVGLMLQQVDRAVVLIHELAR